MASFMKRNLIPRYSRPLKTILFLLESWFFLWRFFFPKLTFLLYFFCFTTAFKALNSPWRLWPWRVYQVWGADPQSQTILPWVRQYSSLAVALMALSCSFKSSQHVSWGTKGRKGSGLHQKGRTDRCPKGHLKPGGNQPASVSLDKNFYKIAFFSMMLITFRFNN